MAFLRATKAAAELKAKEKQARSQVAWATTVGQPGTPYQVNWNVSRAVDQGMRTNVWASRCIDVIASNAAGLPFILRKEDPWSGELVENDPLLPLFNYRPNVYQDSYYFRYKLSGLLLVSKMGAFIEIVRTRGGDVQGLFLLNPDNVFPIRDTLDYVKGYEILAGYERVFRKPEDIVWIGLPDLAKDYERFTFLEPAGLAIESNYHAKVFNRNFLLNDGRPGGILAIKDGIEDADAEVLRNRFLGAAAGGNGPAGAGRLTVLETGEHGVDFVDTATTPRDASYVEMLKAQRDEVLCAFGVPESIIGNAANRTYDNAGVEQEVFWRETMLPHLNLIARALDILTGDKQYAAFDTTSIYILDRDKREQHKFYLDEFNRGLITVDEYREKTGQKPIGDEHRYINAQLIAYDKDGNPALAPVLDPNAPAAVGDSPPGNAGPAGNPPGNLRPLPDGRREPQKPPTTPGDSSGGAVSGVAAAGLTGDEVKETGLHEKEGFIPYLDGNPERPGTPQSIARPARLDPAEGERVHKELTHPLHIPPGESYVKVAEELAKQFGYELKFGDNFTTDLHRQQVEKSWEQHVTKQMQSYFLRQQRVVLEKLTGKRLVEHWNESKALSVAEIFDRSRWDVQLEDDAKVWLAAVVSDFSSEADVDPESHPAVAHQAREVLRVNTTTAGLLDRAITKARSQGKDIDVLALAVKGIFASAVDHRAAEIARTEICRAVELASDEQNDDDDDDEKTE